jgi:A/G-specific adenine glycosylase
LISEFMLQQTQVPRVIPKYHEFLQRFPRVQELAAAPLADVLRVWQGLGYNRRARYVHLAAQHLAAVRSSWWYDDLLACKGVGPNTAAAIVVYTYDEPLVFVETNIRTVYIHHFFADQAAVSDAEITRAIAETLPHIDGVLSCREFYWALMDYGTYLKKQVGNLSQRSKHYAKQSAFQGSLRQIRGAVIRHLAGKPLSLEQLQAYIPDERLAAVLPALRAEGLIVLDDNFYRLA